MKKLLMPALALSLLSLSALCGTASAGGALPEQCLLPIQQSSAPDGLPPLPNRVRFYTEGLKYCEDGGSMMVSYGAEIRVEAQVTGGVLDPSTVKLARSQALAPVVVMASAADKIAGLSVPYGEVLTLSLKCGSGYALTTFTPRSALDLYFTIGRPADSDWKVWVGEVPGIQGLK